MRRSPRSTLFPYTTLFRSSVKRARAENATFTAFEVASVLPDDSAAWLREVTAVADEASTAAYNVVLLNWREEIVEITVPDRKSTRLNSSHSQISYAVFCLK